MLARTQVYGNSVPLRACVPGHVMPLHAGIWLLDQHSSLADEEEHAGRKLRAELGPGEGVTALLENSQRAAQNGASACLQVRSMCPNATMSELRESEVPKTVSPHKTSGACGGQHFVGSLWPCKAWVDVTVTESLSSPFPQQRVSSQAWA